MQICLTSDDPVGIVSNKARTLPGLIMGETTRTSIRTHVTLNKACRNSSSVAVVSVCWKSAGVVKLLLENGGTSSLHSLVVTGVRSVCSNSTLQKS